MEYILQLLDFFQLYILFDFCKSRTSRNVAAKASKAGGRTWGSACTIWFRVWAPETLEELQGQRWVCPQVHKCVKKIVGHWASPGIFFSTTSIQEFEHVTCFILFLQDGGVGWVDDQLATVLFFEARQPFWLRSWVSTCSHEDEHPHEHSQCFEKEDP